MKAIKALIAGALLLTAGGAFAAVTDGQSDNAWLMRPAAPQAIQASAPASASAPVPAPASSSDSKATGSPQAGSNPAEDSLP